MSLGTEATSTVSQVNAAAVILPPSMQQSRRETQFQAKPEEQHNTALEKSPEKEMQKAVDEINAELHSFNTELNFTVDKETDKMVVKIVNSKTHEVVRQIPGEDALRISARIKKLLGLFVDDNA
jgi:flagellar protein FlaG